MLVMLVNVSPQFFLFFHYLYLIPLLALLLVVILKYPKCLLFNEVCLYFRDPLAALLSSIPSGFWKSPLHLQYQPLASWNCFSTWKKAISQTASFSISPLRSILFLLFLCVALLWISCNLFLTVWEIDLNTRCIL